MSKRRLAFIDPLRQSYAEQLGLGDKDSEEQAFNVGFYSRDGGVYPGGEFLIELIALGSLRSPHPPVLTPRLLVFTDGIGALRELDRLGGLDVLEREKVYHRDDLARILLGLGLRDDSHEKLPKGER